ncbi:hypothetical protein ACOSQ3_016685 [Xanthoceras sorbifolium]
MHLLQFEPEKKPRLCNTTKTKIKPIHNKRKKKRNQRGNQRVVNHYTTGNRKDNIKNMLKTNNKRTCKLQTKKKKKLTDGSRNTKFLGSTIIVVRCSHPNF